MNLKLDEEHPVGNPISRVDALRTVREILERAEQERAQLAELEAKRGLKLDEEQNELLEGIVNAFAAYQPGDEQRSRDTRILDWIEEERPDIWFRTGYGVWSVSAEMDDPEFPNYDGRTLREAITTAMMAWDDDDK